MGPLTTGLIACIGPNGVGKSILVRTVSVVVHAPRPVTVPAPRNLHQATGLQGEAIAFALGCKAKFLRVPRLDALLSHTSNGHQTLRAEVARCSVPISALTIDKQNARTAMHFQLNT